MAELVCPRCGRDVLDIERNRNAHRQTCVRIPRVRPRGWGVRILK